jgi:hypothetical protein
MVGLEDKTKMHGVFTCTDCYTGKVILECKYFYGVVKGKELIWDPFSKTETLLRKTYHLVIR